VTEQGRRNARKHCRQAIDQTVARGRASGTGSGGAPTGTGAEGRCREDPRGPTNTFFVEVPIQLKGWAAAGVLRDASGNGAKCAARTSFNLDGAERVAPGAAGTAHAAEEDGASRCWPPCSGGAAGSSEGTWDLRTRVDLVGRWRDSQ